jgi:Rrf2 family protein
MLFSVGCEHAIRALTYLAAHCPPGEIRQVKVIAKALNLSQPTVAKVMHELVRRDLVRSNKGRGGGFALARDPADIHLIEVVKSIDGIADFERCIVGCAECRDENPCPLHPSWKSLREQILDYLHSTSLKDLAEAEHAQQVPLVANPALP